VIDDAHQTGIDAWTRSELLDGAETARGNASFGHLVVSVQSEATEGTPDKMLDDHSRKSIFSLSSWSIGDS
jgi:hypothetical protein